MLGEGNLPSNGEGHGPLAHSQEVGLLLLYELMVTAHKCIHLVSMTTGGLSGRCGRLCLCT